MVQIMMSGLPSGLKLREISFRTSGMSFFFVQACNVSSMEWALHWNTMLPEALAWG